MESEECPRRILSVARITTVRGKFYEVIGCDNPFVILRYETCKRGPIIFHIPVVKFMSIGSLDVRIYVPAGLEKEDDYLKCQTGAYISLIRTKEWLEKLKRKVTWGKEVRQFERLPKFSIAKGFESKRDWMSLLEAIAEIGRAREKDSTVIIKSLFLSTFEHRFEIPDYIQPEICLSDVAYDD